MMKKTIFKLALAGTLVASTGLSLSGNALADSFTQYSNDDLFGMRDQVRSMDDDARNAYRNERQSRMQGMDQTARQSRMNDMGASGRQKMERLGRGGMERGQGGGNGAGNRYRYGQGGGGNYQNTNRYGSGISDGHYGGNRSYSAGMSAGRYGGGR